MGVQCLCRRGDNDWDPLECKGVTKGSLDTCETFIKEVI